MTVVERMKRAGWKSMKGSAYLDSFWNNEHSFIFVMHHPKYKLYHARIESANIRDVSFESIHKDRFTAIQNCKNHLRS